MAKDEFGTFAPDRGSIVRNDGWVDAQIDRYEDVVEYIADTAPQSRGELSSQSATDALSGAP